jgi:colicin import membrane protein
MSLIRVYIFPALLALAVHAGVLTLLLVNWDQAAPIPSVAVEHYYIKAALVAENPHKIKQQKLAAAALQRRQAKAQLSKQRDSARRAQLDRDAKAKADLATKASQAAEYSRLEALRAAAQQAEEQQALEAKQAKVATERDLARAIGEEQDDRLAVTDDEKAMAYVSQIQREIIQHWSRPPSARNGMQALLKVFLVPTGEVVDVTLKTSSGNDAFDRSAMLAVRKAERFIVPADSAQFERNFREFEVVFRPEDLRL